jgi:hypothetical protein
MQFVKVFFLGFVVVLLATKAEAQLNQNLEAFNQLYVFGKIEVRLEPGETPGIELESGDFDVEKVKFEVKDSVLELKLTYEFPASIKVKATVYYTHLSIISANVGAKIYNKGAIESDCIELVAKSGCDLDLLIEADSVDATVNKGAFIRLSGSAKALNLKTATGGDFRSNAMSSKFVYAKMRGGTAEVSVSELLIADVRLGASLKYLEKPKMIEQTVKLKGSIGILEDF